MSRWQLRWRRAVSAATSRGSPRSQPSDTTITMPLVRRTRRAQRRLNSRKLSPMRVPPAQSVTVSETRRRAASRSRVRSSRVTRVRRVPKTKDSVRTWLEAARAWMNLRSRRDWRAIEQLGGCHPVELPMAEDLRGAVGVRRDDESFDGFVVILVVASGGHRHADGLHEGLVDGTIHRSLALIALARIAE